MHTTAQLLPLLTSLLLLRLCLLLLLLLQTPTMLHSLLS
jgi:hypothetical protein